MTSELTMVVEQTARYTMRLVYDPATKTFTESDRPSLLSVRGFPYPYGWIRESGTPPAPHWDVMLMSEGAFEPGDEVAVRVIGLFRRADGDHKYVAVERSRPTNDLSELSEEEHDALRRLYPRVGENEGWFGHGEALYCMEHHEKAL